MGDTVRIALVVDWSRSPRANFWPAVFEELLDDGLEPSVDIYHLADRVAPAASPAPGGRHLPSFARVCSPETLIANLKRTDVLVVNWDVVNGDPDFGADFAMRWFSTRRTEILQWVRSKPGLLLCEGQAAYSIPVQAAYDALIGPAELVVCGAEDERRPKRQKFRIGDKAYVTSVFRRVDAFADLKDLTIRWQQRHEDMFPPPAASLVAPYLRHTNWGTCLYRGWFAAAPFRSRRFKWTTVVRARRPRARDRPIMKAARHGTGIIVVSTMNLAPTGQYELVKAALDLRNDPTAFSATARTMSVLRQATGVAVPGAAAAVAAGVGQSVAAQSAVEVGVALGVGALAAVARPAYRGARRVLRAMLGR